jgi:hypothetical protein
MRIVSIDTETFLIAPGVAAPKLVCLSHDDGDDSGVLDHADGLDFFLKLLRDPSTVIPIHHAPFDLGVLVAEVYERDGSEIGEQVLREIFAAIKARQICCTLIREKILENARGELKYDWDPDLEEYKAASFTLERCCWNRLKDEDGRRLFVNKSADTWRKRYGLLYGVPISDWPDDAFKYALKDAQLHRRLFLAQEETALSAEFGASLREDGLADIPGETATTLTALCLGLMRIWGVRTDPEMVKVVRAEFQEKFDAAVAIASKWKLVGEKRVSQVLPEYAERYSHLTEKEIKKLPARLKHRVVVPKREMKKIRDRVQYCYTSRGEDVPMSESGKNIATDRETLTFKRYLSWLKDEGLVAVADVVRYEKLLKTYVPVLERGARYPITPDWNAMVETFRISCARPNLTNLPRGSAKHGDDMVRQCFQARPGCVFVSADYSTLELCTLAQTCIDLFGYSAMADSINQGRDLHIDMASAILEISYEDAFARYVAGDKLMEETRQFSKIVDFGAPGGMGAASFVEYARGYDVSISEDHARRLLMVFRSRWHEMNEYFAYCSALCAEGSEAEIAVHPRTGYVRGKVRYTALANHGFQHLAAVGATSALSAVSEECYVDPSSALYGSRPVVFAHDEIILEVPRASIGPERASATADRLVNVMVAVMKEHCPDIVIKVDAVMMLRWMKGAKPVRVGGLLVPSRREGKVWVADEGELCAA